MNGSARRIVRMTTMTGTMLVRTIGLAALALSAIACGGGSDRTGAALPEAPEVAAAVETVEIATLPDWTEATASVEAWRRVTPGTKILGRVERVPVREGDRVGAGAVLAKLESRDLEAAVAQARAAVAMAVAQFKVAESMRRRMTDLHARGSATTKNLEDAEAGFLVATAGVAQARANVAAAEVMLGYAEVRSPVAGWVVERRVEAGDMASPGMPLFVVDDLSKVKVVVEVPESDVLGLAAGKDAVVAVPVLDREIPGRIERMVPGGDPTSRTYEVQIVLANPDGALRSGMFARVRFERGTRDTIAVPSSAIVRRGQLDGVFVLDADGRARIRWIRGRAIPGDPSRFEITSGLGAGERFLPAPPAALADGGRVKEA